MDTSRRHFVRSAGIFGALFLTRGLVACSAPSGSGETGSSSDALATCDRPVIGRNHGHTLVVSSEDVEAAVTKTYSIQGVATHDHQVTLTAENFAALAAGGSITVSSTTTVGHAHPITVTCAVSAPSTDAGAPDSGPAVCADGATAAAISSNHGHTLTVPTADVAAASTKTYSIKGAASHDHTVTLNPADFAQLAAGATITVTSSTGASHSHVVKVVCA